ncbi:hypothetical protein ACET3Z_005025 [Daucus carota]
MAKLRAELTKMIAENEKLKGAQLVTLGKKADERPSSSSRDELQEEIHDKLDQLLRNSKSNDQPSEEDPSTKGENRGDKGDRDDRGNSSNQSNKGNTTSGSAPDKESDK